MNKSSSYEEKLKEPVYRSTGVGGCRYAIFRVGERKYKNIGQLKHYQNHMERQVDVPNADKNIRNELLIGSGNILKDFAEYTKDIKFRSNNVLARDLLLTASPDFFKNISIEEKRQWVDLNVKWLKNRFGDNCIYATLHKDESTWHISALVVPKFYDYKKERYILANARYFDGKKKLSLWLDDYSDNIKTVFKTLRRGIKFSKAKHIEVRQYYTIINSKLNEKDITQVCAKARSTDLLQRKVLELQSTLNKYQYSSHKNREENKILLEQLQDIKTDKYIFKESIKAMSEIYKIPQYSIKKILQYVEKQLQDNKEEINKNDLERDKS